MSPVDLNNLINVADLMPDGVAILGPDGAVIHCNPAMLDLLGGPDRAEIIGRPPSEAWGEPDPPDETARPAELECAVFGPSGAPRHVSVKSVPVQLDQKQGWLCVYRDQTAARQAERSLRETNLQFQQLAENMSETLWLSSRDQSRWDYVSPAFSRIWRRDVKEMTGLGLSTVHPDDRVRFIQAFRDALGKDRVELEYRITRPDGSIRWIRTRAFPIRDQNGSPIRIGGTSEDITESRAADEALKEAERGKEQFYRFLVHDLNKPVAAIVGLSADLQSMDALDENAKALADRIQNASVRLRKVIAQTLEVERIRRGELTLRMTRFNLWDQVIEVAGLFIGAGARGRITLAGRPAESPGELPPVMVFSDPTCLSRVIQNLIDNAVKYGQGGIEIDVAERNGEAVTTVWNDGPPIPREHHERIFSEFYRVDGTRRDGVGIGLASVRRLLELLGGKVWVESPDRGGVAFMVQTPRAAHESGG